MREDVDVRPPGEIQPSACWKKVERCAGKVGASFAIQAFIEFFFQAMQIKNIRCGICQLGFGQVFRSPFAHLLDFRDIDAHQLVEQVHQSVAVGIGTGQLGGDLGAINRSRQRAKGIVHRGDVKTAEVEQL